MSDDTTQPEAGDDVEGHRHSFEPQPGAIEDDDVEGHRLRQDSHRGAVDSDDDDVEGHSLRGAPAPGLKTGALDSDEDTPGFRV